MLSALCHLIGRQCYTDLKKKKKTDRCFLSFWCMFFLDLFFCFKECRPSFLLLLFFCYDTDLKKKGGDSSSPPSPPFSSSFPSLLLPLLIREYCVMVFCNFFCKWSLIKQIFVNYNKKGLKEFLLGNFFFSNFFVLFNKYKQYFYYI